MRVARPDELPGLVRIELAADAMFAPLGIVFPPGSVAEEITPEMTAYVAGDPAVGFALVGPVDGRRHLHQLAVDPAHGRRGIGSALLAVAAAETLTTFRDVPWNLPWYARRGWAVLDEPSPELAELAAEEERALAGLGPRVIMAFPR